MLNVCVQPRPQRIGKVARVYVSVSVCRPSPSHINTLTGTHTPTKPPTNPHARAHTPEISNRRKKGTVETVSSWVYPASFSLFLPITFAFPPLPPLPSPPVSPTPTLASPDPVADTRAQHTSTLFSEKLKRKCCSNRTGGSSIKKIYKGHSQDPPTLVVKCKETLSRDVTWLRSDAFKKISCGAGLFKMQRFEIF
jgi:hypothetical protein